jgi:MarR family transcriptional regulator, transcriptional regulator for hemolysin
MGHHLPKNVVAITIVNMETKSNMINSDKFERSFGFLIHDIARMMRLDFERRVRSSGLTRAQWFVLAHLIRTNGQTQTALAEETDVEKAALGKLLDRLEEGGWIERRPDAADRRVRHVFKTNKVDPLIAVMHEATANLHETALKGLDINARERLIDDLITVKGNLLNQS